MLPNASLIGKISCEVDTVVPKFHWRPSIALSYGGGGTGSRFEGWQGRIQQDYGTTAFTRSGFLVEWRNEKATGFSDAAWVDGGWDYCCCGFAE